MGALKITIKRQTVYSLALLVIVGCITYLPYINQLGFYYNDWRALDSQISGISLVEIFSSDRPLLGLHLQIMQGILGNAQLGWHLYTLGLRIGGALLLFWVVRMLWSDKRLVTTTMAALFLVYPGFLRQPMAITYHTHLTVLLLSILSIGLTIAAFRAEVMWQKIVLTVLSILTGITYLMLIEYFVGMEAVRLVIIIFLHFKEKQSSFNFKALPAIFVRWLPYFVMTLVFLVYRLFFFVSTRSTTDVGGLASLYRQQPLQMLLQLGLDTIKSFFDTAFLAWFVPLYQTLKLTGYHEWMISILLAIVAAGIFVLFARLIRQTQASVAESEATDRSGVEMMALGAVILLAGLLPILVSNRQVSFDDLMDRYTMPAAIGTVLLIGGALLQWVNRYRIMAAIFTVLIVISIITQVNNTSYYRDDWAVQKDLWWQISWRAPSFQKGTVLMIDLPSPYYLAEDEEIYAPANDLYFHQPGNFRIYAEVINADTLEELQTHDVSWRNFRGIAFERDFSKAVIISLDAAGGCVHLYDSKQVENFNLETPIVNLAAAYSNADQIITTETAPTPPADVFGSEPAHNWCYYYQKASLARQQHDWAEVARLGDEAIAKNLTAYDPLEWVPFVEGYINMGREADALQILSRIPYGYDRISMCNVLISGGGAYSTGASLQRLETMFCENR
ncbi:MAG TPA: hypothetical protein VMC62_03375 [Longilinea sp.]|nr:hypothetical protein [Longilinea sp.]